MSNSDQGNSQYHPPYYEGRERAEQQYKATVEMLAREDRRDAMLRGFAIWVAFMAVLFAVAVGIAWVLA